MPKFTPLTKEQDLKYQLQTLAGYSQADLDNPEIEVVYEDCTGSEGELTVGLTELGQRAYNRIEELETRVAILQEQLDISIRKSTQNVPL